MSELSDDLSNEGDEDGGSRARGARHHDFAGPNKPRSAERSTAGGSGEEDSFFENLMSELGGALDGDPSSSSSPSARAKSERKLDDDDFFSSLEAELSQSLGGDFGGGKSSGDDDDDDDFFASLQAEMGKALDEGGDEGEDDGDDGDDDMTDDFFSSLMNDMADELADELETPPPAKTGSKEQTGSGSHAEDFSSLTVPELKELLKRKGLKVGGKKAELIDRLQGSS